MDAKSLTFQSEYFDGIIDKALYDCIMVNYFLLLSALKTLNKMHIKCYVNFIEF